MVWNKKAQTWAYGIMLGITVIVLVLALAFPIKQGVDNARNESSESGGIENIGMNCSTTTDNFVKAGCYVTDLSPFYFVGSVIFIAGAIILAKVVLQ